MVGFLALEEIGIWNPSIHHGLEAFFPLPQFLKIPPLQPDLAPDRRSHSKKQRIPVSSNYVSTIKSNLKGGGKGKKKVRRKKKVAAKKKAAPKKKAADDKISLSALKEAKKLATTLGGIEEAKQAINALAQLTD